MNPPINEDISYSCVNYSQNSRYCGKNTCLNCNEYDSIYNYEWMKNIDRHFGNLARLSDIKEKKIKNKYKGIKFYKI